MAFHEIFQFFTSIPVFSWVRLEIPSPPSLPNPCSDLMFKKGQIYRLCLTFPAVGV